MPLNTSVNATNLLNGTIKDSNLFKETSSKNTSEKNTAHSSNSHNGPFSSKINSNDSAPISASEFNNTFKTEMTIASQNSTINTLTEKTHLLLEKCKTLESEKETLEEQLLSQYLSEINQEKARTAEIEKKLSISLAREREMNEENEKLVSNLNDMEITLNQKDREISLLNSEHV